MRKPIAVQEQCINHSKQRASWAYKFETLGKLAHVFYCTRCKAEKPVWLQSHMEQVTSK